MDAERQPPKKDVARALLLRGSLFVHLDPRAEGVVVPEFLKDQPQLVLQLGLDMPVPIPDLKVGDEGVHATLSFQRSPFTCEVPWDAVFAMAGDDGRGMVWPESMPPEIIAEVEREAGRRAAADVDRALARVDVALATDEDDDEDDTPGEVLAFERPASATRGAGAGKKPKRRLPPYLRVIK